MNKSLDTVLDTQFEPPHHLIQNYSKLKGLVCSNCVSSTHSRGLFLQYKYMQYMFPEFLD